MGYHSVYLAVKLLIHCSFADAFEFQKSEQVTVLSISNSGLGAGFFIISFVLPGTFRILHDNLRRSV